MRCASSPGASTSLPGAWCPPRAGRTCTCTTCTAQPCSCSTETKRADQIIKLIDVDAFVAWLRDTVGDAALADAIARECPADDPYRDRLENVQRLLALRMVQYGAASDAMNAADAEQDEGA